MISFTPTEGKFILQDIFNSLKKNIMKNLLIPILIFAGISMNAIGQEKSSKELKGDKYYFNYSFDKSIDLYNRANQLTPEGQRNLAVSYSNIDKTVESEEAYLKLINTGKEIVPEDYYSYSMILKSNGKYAESQKWMDRFIELKPNDLRVKDYLSHKASLPELKKDFGKYKITNLNINSEALDFGTSYYKDQIVFASTRSTPRMIVRKYNWTGKPFWDIYVSDVDGGQLKSPVIFDKSMNDKLHDGPVSFNHDGTQIAYTKNNYDHKRKDEVIELQIWLSSFKDDQWTDPEPFVLNNVKYSVGQPFLTSDGMTMYFTSDMPGGFGGTDIYRITRNAAGVWGKAENLGNQINTEGDEMFPFLEQKSNTFFFSSNGRFGLGGLDMFTSVMNETGFGPATNMGSPLNTQYDDFALIINDKMNKGYFSSSRPGGKGGDDIYAFDVLIPDIIEDVDFIVKAPLNIPSKPIIREYFPLRNYIFFKAGTTEIPARYVLLKKDQVRDFKEDQLESIASLNVHARSARQMTVYYNILNILGDRMEKNPSSSIKLVGSSAQGPEQARKMAESCKNYLVDVFDINPSRILIEGRNKPKIPSEKVGGKLELELLREEDERVSIESATPALLNQFYSGNESMPFEPVQIVNGQENSSDGFATFNVAGAEKTLRSWALKLESENGEVQHFGPFTQDMVEIDQRSILGDNLKQNYKVTMTGQTKSGAVITKESNLQLELLPPITSPEVTRFSIIFEFDDSRSISIYEKYLTDVVVPKITSGGTVIIHGFTDVIGEVEHNRKLSIARATEVKNIIEKGLSNAGIKDVKLDVQGFGEDVDTAPFENLLPERHFYNRTVIIDIKNN
jgi:outer membrane protein OmpA-like peptidoglycan-associated protein/tetratricopeptide (TPR) repeat protein